MGQLPYVVGDDYEDIEIDAADETVPDSHEDEAIFCSLSSSGDTIISINEDERDNVSLSSKESETVSDVGLIGDLSIGHLDVSGYITINLSKKFIDF